MVAEYINLDRLATQIGEIKQQLFSGRISLKSSAGREWVLYVYLGRILYATGGNHQIRRWVRNSLALGIEVGNVDDLQARIEALTNISALTPAEINNCWEYYLLVNWAKQGRIERNGLLSHIQNTIIEVLFDIVSAGQVSYQQIEENPLSPQLTLLDLDRAFNLAREQYQQWQQADLGDLTPDRTISIVKMDEFERMVSPKAFKTMQSVLDGNSTVREIAIKVRKSDLTIARSFQGYLRSGILKSLAVKDFSSPLAGGKHSRGAKAPTIVCIDDSPFVCERLEQIFQEAGYQFVSILDSLKAIPIVIAKKPQLIFLDLVMPNANGYEICSRLRKVGNFSDTPIVILTGNDGVIDRVRAKVVGATDFITKPVQAEQVLEIAEKYLAPVSTK